jgi:CO dehydrogenase maturation factor
VGNVVLIVNRIRDGVPPVLQEAITAGHLKLLGTLPDHPAVREFDAQGQPLAHLPDDDPLRQRVIELAQQVGLP